MLTHKGFNLTNAGYVSDDGNMILTSAIDVGGNHGDANGVDAKERHASRIMRAVSCGDIDIVSKSNPASKTLSEPSPSQLATFLFNVFLGTRVATPSTSNVYLDRPTKTFLAAYHAPQLTYDAQHAIDVCGLYNYVIMGGRNPERGVMERVYREYLLTQATLAENVIRMLDGHDASGDVTYVFARQSAPERRNITVTLGMLDDIERALVDDASVLAYLDGMAYMCSYHDHRKSIGKLKTPTAQKIFDTMDDEYLDSAYIEPDRFLSYETAVHLIYVGDRLNDLLYVIPDGTDDVIDAYADGNMLALLAYDDARNDDNERDGFEIDDDDDDGDDEHEQVDESLTNMRIDGVALDVNAIDDGYQNDDE